MIVKCPSCEVEFSANPADGPEATCPVCSTPVALSPGGEAAAAAPSRSEVAAPSAPPRPAPAREMAAPQAPRPRPAAQGQPQAQRGPAFRDEEVTYSKKSGDLKYSEEVIWPSRPSRGARKPGMTAEGMGAAAAPPRRPAAPRQEPPRQEPMGAPRGEARTSSARRGMVEPGPIPPPAHEAPLEEVPPATSRRPTRVMDPLSATPERPESAFEARGTVQHVDLLQEGPPVSSAARDKGVLDIDFDRPASPRGAILEEDLAGGTDEVFEPLDLGSLMGDGETTSPDARPSREPVPVARSAAARTMTRDAAASPPMGGRGVPDAGVFSLEFGPDEAEGGAGGEPLFEQSLAEPADAPSASRGPGVEQVVVPEGAETFFVESSFGAGASEPPMGAPASAPGDGLEFDTGGMGLDEAAGQVAGPGATAAPVAAAAQRSRKEAAKASAKRKSATSRTVALLVLLLLVGVGLITSQTDYGVYGLNLIFGMPAPKPSTAPQTVAVQSEALNQVAQTDTVGSYKEQIVNLEKGLKSAESADEKERFNRDLLTLHTKFRERFPEQFAQEPALGARLDELAKLVPLTGGTADNLAVLQLSKEDPEAAKKQLERQVAARYADADQLAMYGKVEFKQKNYDNAIYYFKEALKKSPESMETLFYLGQALRESGSVEGAKKVFEEILRKNNQHLSSILELSKIHVAESNLGKAEEYALQADRKAKESKDLGTQFEAHRLLASIHLKREDLLGYKKELETTIQINPNDESTVLDLARVEDKLGNAANSLNYLDKFHERNQQFSSDFYVTATQLCLKLGEPDRAKSYSKEGVDRFAQEPAMQLAYGSALEAKGENFAAKEVYSRVIQGHPDLSDAYLAVGRIEQKEKAYDAAVQILKDGAAKVRNPESLHKALVEVYLEVRDFNNATAAIQEVLKLNPRDNDNRLLLADILKRRGYLDQAEAEYQILYKNGYIPDQMILSYSEVLRDRGKYDQALHELDLLKEKRPNDVGVLTRIASVMVIKGQLEQAEALLKQAQVANATYEPMYYYLGLLNENRKNFEEAMTNYRKALVLDPDDLEARYHFAVLQGQSKSNKEVQEAIKHLTYITGKYETQRRKESEMNSLVFLERGRLYFKIKLFKKALADFQQAISIDPTNIETLVAYGEVLITDNKLDEARIYLTEAIARNDKLYAAYFHLGKIHALQKQTRLAQKYFEIARSGDTSKYPEVHKMLGFMYRDLGLKPQAKGELKRYLAIAPAGYDTKEIQELLDKL